MKTLKQIKSELLFVYERYRLFDDYQYVKIVDESESVEELFEDRKYSRLFRRICDLPVYVLMD